MSVQQLIVEQVSTHPVVLYMKGTPRNPVCGYSATAVQILQACNLPLFFSVNVLEYPEIREGVKIFSDWPTLPQLYIRGEFIGGATSCVRCTRAANFSNYWKVAPRRIEAGRRVYALGAVNSSYARTASAAYIRVGPPPM